MEIGLIINRLREVFEVSSDLQLSKKLGLGNTTVGNWRNRNTVDYELVISKCENVDLNWLFRGKPLSAEKNELSNDNLLDVLRQQNEFLIKQIEMKDKMIEKLMNI